jgi:hypothetical protein
VNSKSCGLSCLGVTLAVLSGCAEVIPWLVNPTGAAAATANSVASSLTSVDTTALANTTSQDLDRILNENPDAVNNAELRSLRNELANQPQTGKVIPPDDLPAEHHAQFDRRAGDKERNKTDKLVLRTNDQYVRPRGIRATPRSHVSNEALPATQENYPIMDLSPVRFGK